MCSVYFKISTVAGNVGRYIFCRWLSIYIFPLLMVIGNRIGCTRLNLFLFSVWSFHIILYIKMWFHQIDIICMNLGSLFWNTFNCIYTTRYSSTRMSFMALRIVLWILNWLLRKWLSIYGQDIEHLISLVLFTLFSCLNVGFIVLTSIIHICNCGCVFKYMVHDGKVLRLSCGRYKQRRKIWNENLLLLLLLFLASIMDLYYSVRQ